MVKHGWCTCGFFISLITAITADYFTQIAQKYGYPVEVHKNIQTPDGYLLTIHRIPHGKSENIYKKRVPVLLMHGIVGSSEHFIIAGPRRSLGFLLAEEGYDVWFGNVRSVSYSRHHVKYDPDTDRAYWNFTQHEFGVYDLPTTIDYILEKTGFDTLFYGCHSQGCLIFFIMCSEMPEYNRKIKLYSGLGSVIFLNNASHPFLPEIAKYGNDFNKLLDMLHLDEFRVPRSLKRLSFSICQLPFMSDICRILIMAMSGSDNQQFDARVLPDMLLNNPEGVGRLQFFHLSQIYNSGNFQRYDYGIQKNLQIYGQTKPPLYDLTKATVPVALYYSLHDWFLPVENHKRTVRLLPNVVEQYQVPNKEFSHMDFIIAKDVYPLLYKRVIEVMNKYRNIA